MSAGRALPAGLLASLLLAGSAAAHPLAPSLLELREREGGIVDVRFKQPLLRARGSELRPVLPGRCAPLEGPRAARDAVSAELHWRVDCGTAGLVGAALRVDGLDESGTDALVRVELADGRRARAVLDASADALVVPARQARTVVAVDYLALGFQHILSGFDHLLFVLGLVLLVSGPGALAKTVTAFTLGHSATLSLAALGFVRFPTALVEVAIAASIVWLAVELRTGARGLAARRPWAMALGFGLLHGLGFAGALAEAGLPAGEIPLALLCFNVGIELGQLLFVAAVVPARAALRARAAAPVRKLAPLPAWAIGSLAACWLLERAAVLL